MDEEDDARSESLSRSQSPSPPPPTTRQTISEESPAGPPPHHQPNGRVTEPVTIAAPPQQTLTLALPIQRPRAAAAAGSGGGGGGGGREDCWSEGATSALIDAWGERFLELRRGNLKQKQWQEVADAVSSRDDYTKPPKTDVQCKNRIDTLKKKYKLEKSKIPSGAGAGAAWPFFHRLDLLIGPTQKPTPTTNPPPPTSNTKPADAAFAIHPPFPQRQRTHHPTQKNNKKRSPSLSPSKSGGLPADSSDGFPPKTSAANGRKRQRPFPEPEMPPPPPPPPMAAKMRGLRELTKAILRFGEVYERVESSKLQQVVEMEKQRMGFSRELELQRMEFFVKTQMELSQLNHHHHHGDGIGRRRKKSIGGTTTTNNSNSSN